MPEISTTSSQQPSIWGRTWNYLGLDYHAPKSSIECLREIHQVFPIIRGAVGDVLNWSND